MSSMATVPGREDRSWTFAAVSLRVARVPAVDPSALAFGCEQFHGLLGRKVDRDFGGAKNGSAHVENLMCVALAFPARP